MATKKMPAKSRSGELAIGLLAKSFHLTPDEVEDFRETFNVFDKDGNGKIDVEELGHVMRNLGQNPSEADILAMIKDLDADGSGTVEFAEFLSMYARKVRKNKDGEAEEVMAAFKAFDRNGDGFISASELHHVMSCMGERLTEAEVSEMILAADTDGNGRIDYNEFSKIVLKKQ